MFKKESIKYNGYTVQSPDEELPAGEQITDDPLTLTWASLTNPEGYYIRITEFDLTKIRLKNPAEAKEGAHGSIFGASSDQVRIIKITGEICAKDAESKMKGWQTLNRMFRPDEFPSILNKGLFKMEFQDYSAEDWFLYAQVDSDYTNLNNDKEQSFLTPFTVFLKCEDTRIFSDVIAETTIEEGDIGGLDIGGQNYGGIFTQPLDGLAGAESISNPLPNSAPATVTITKNTGVTSFTSPYLAIDPKLTDASSGKYFQVSWNMALNDIIVIDTLAGTVKVNGVTKAIKVVGSDFPVISIGDNYYILSDKTGIALFGKKIKAKIEYRKIMK